MHEEAGVAAYKQASTQTQGALQSICSLTVGGHVEVQHVEQPHLHRVHHPIGGGVGPLALVDHTGLQAKATAGEGDSISRPSPPMGAGPPAKRVKNKAAPAAL